MNVAVIGCGGIGRMHAQAWQGIPGVTVRYMIDRMPEVAKAAAERFGAEPLTDLSQMREKPDLVSVVTPPDAHAGIILQLLGQGIPVFSEKPLTMDVEEAEAIVAESRRTGVPVGIGFKMRHEPVFAKAKSLVPRLGRLYAVSVTKNQPYNPRPNGWVPRVGCMYELSVHEYDLVRWMADLRAADVSAELCYDLGWERENRAYLDVNYEGGVKGQLMSIYAPATTFTFRDLTIAFFGEKGYLRIERPDRILLHIDQDELIAVEPKDNAAVFVEELSSFLDALREGRPVDPGAREGADMTRLIEAARRSDRERARVAVGG